MTKNIKDYTKEDFLNDFANIWEYRFKKVKSGKYKRYDLQFDNEYVDTKTIEIFLSLYYDFLNDSDTEEINGIEIEDYTEKLGKMIGVE